MCDSPRTSCHGALTIVLLLSSSLSLYQMPLFLLKLCTDKIASHFARVWDDQTLR